MHVCPGDTYHSQEGNYHKYLLTSMTKRKRLSLDILELMHTAVTNSM